MHYWFPVYEESFAKCSPGLFLLMRMAQAAPGMGIRKIDLGKEDSLYKQRLSNGGIELAEARVEVRSASASNARFLANKRDQIRRTR